jgi:hypothetical protein
MKQARNRFIFASALTIGALAFGLTAYAGPGKLGTQKLSTSPKQVQPINQSLKNVQKPVLQHKLSPKTQKLIRVGPLSKSAKIRELAKRGIKLSPAALRKPITLTPRKLYHDATAHIATLHQGYVVPGDEPAHVDFQGSFRGALEIKIVAAPNTAYMFDCTMTGGGKSLAWVGDGGSSARVEQVESDNRFTHAVGGGNRRTVTILLAAERSWHWNRCTITPAAL